VVFGAVIHVGGAGGDGVEALERRYEFAGREQLYRELAVSEQGDVVGNPLCGGAQAREVLRPGRDELELALALGDGRRRQCRRGGGGAGHAGSGNKRTTLHWCLPSVLPPRLARGSSP